MSASVRAATWDDRGAILALIATMGGHEDILSHADPMRELGALLRNSNSRALVASVAERIVGVAFVQARSSITGDERIAWLGGVSVDEALRGSGVGALLLRAAEEAARTLGCARIALQSSERRVRAHAFYRSHGYIEESPAARFSRPVSLPERDATIVARFLALAARAASSVDGAIVGLSGATSVGMGADGAATEAVDLAAETAAVAVLRDLSLPIVSEEAGVIGDDPRGNDMWISLDPLDGSRNFRAGLPPYGIAIGLVRAGVALAGFVCDLSSGRRWWAGDDGLAYADGRIVRSRRGELIGMPSPPSDHDLVRPRNVRHRARISGSCALDLCRVADGSLSAFVALARPVVHAHDLAGPLAILHAAGACVRDQTGAEPLIVPDPSQAYRLVAAADEELAERLRASG
jgi:3'(2'), 5'-bisphosphate nucleotidase